MIIAQPFGIDVADLGVKRKDRNSYEDLPHQKCKSCNQCRELYHNDTKGSE